jgi:hypothetical protein
MGLVYCLQHPGHTLYIPRRIAGVWPALVWDLSLFIYHVLVGGLLGLHCCLRYHAIFVRVWTLSGFGTPFFLLCL